MKTMGILLALFVSCLAYAGGTIGGGSGGLARGDLALELAEQAFDIQSLPKAYVDSESFRRAGARLSVAGTSSVTATTIDGEAIELKKFKDSLVDVDFSKEVLPNP